MSVIAVYVKAFKMISFLAIVNGSMHYTLPQRLYPYPYQLKVDRVPDLCGMLNCCCSWFSHFSSLHNFADVTELEL